MRHSLRNSFRTDSTNKSRTEKPETLPFKPNVQKKPQTAALLSNSSRTDSTNKLKTGKMETLSLVAEYLQMKQHVGMQAQQIVLRLNSYKIN